MIRAAQRAQGRAWHTGDTAERGPATRSPMPTTRPGQACNTAQCARIVPASWAGCAPGAPNQFWTQCTVSESLFGTLFMNTVHEHCSQFFFKIK